MSTCIAILLINILDSGSCYEPMSLSDSRGFLLQTDPFINLFISFIINYFVGRFFCLKQIQSSSMSGRVKFDDWVIYINLFMSCILMSMSLVNICRVYFRILCTSKSIWHEICTLTSFMNTTQKIRDNKLFHMFLRKMNRKEKWNIRNLFKT